MVSINSLKKCILQYLKKNEILVLIPYTQKPPIKTYDVYPVGLDV